jgi:hypothetical protein
MERHCLLQKKLKGKRKEMGKRVGAPMMFKTKIGAPMKKPLWRYGNIHNSAKGPFTTTTAEKNIMGH